MVAKNSVEAELQENLCSVGLTAYVVRTYLPPSTYQATMSILGNVCISKSCRLQALITNDRLKPGFSLPPLLYPYSDKQTSEYSRVQGWQYSRRQRPGFDPKCEAHPRGQAARAGTRDMGPLRLPEREKHRWSRTVGEELNHSKAESLKLMRLCFHLLCRSSW